MNWRMERSMNILLVEDDAPLAMGIQYALKKNGFNIQWGKTLQEARSLFDAGVDLILLDVTLPDGSGYDFCKEVRNACDVPVIFITALDDEANVVFGLDTGGDDYISKPIRLSELISRINALMRRRKRSPSGTGGCILSGSVAVEPLRCKVTVGGEEASLTAVEYKLLLLLLENREKVLNRNTIIEKLWDIDGNFVDYNTLNVYVKRLREKIEINGEKHIETVRGLGYVWRDIIDR